MLFRSHLIKHRIGVSVNSESARYKELKEDKFYVPDDWPEAERSAYSQFAERAFEEMERALEAEPGP